MGAAASGSRADVQFIVFAAIMLHKVKGCAENFCKGNKIAKKKREDYAGLTVQTSGDNLFLPTLQKIIIR